MMSSEPSLLFGAYQVCSLGLYEANDGAGSSVNTNEHIFA